MHHPLQIFRLAGKVQEEEGRYLTCEKPAPAVILELLNFELLNCVYGVAIRRWNVSKIKSALRRTPNLLSRLET